MAFKMNRLVALLNRVRAESEWNWLTESQLHATRQLRDLLRVHDAVNLFGRRGVGKTFLAWQWVKNWHQLGFGRIAHFSLLKQLVPTQTARVAIVDNLSAKRDAIREALRQCRAAGYHRIVLITISPADDQLPRVRLDLMESEMAEIAERLRALGFPPYTDEPRSLWELVIPMET